mgnify:CR=1 FL=1
MNKYIRFCLAVLVTAINLVAAAALTVVALESLIIAFTQPYHFLYGAAFLVSSIVAYTLWESVILPAIND